MFQVAGASGDDIAYLEITSEGVLQRGPEIVNVVQTGHQRRPDVAVGADGAVTVVWRTTEGGVVVDIRYAVLEGGAWSTDLAPWPGSGAASGEIEALSDRPGVGALADGRVLMAWAMNRGDEDELVYTLLPSTCPHGWGACDELGAPLVCGPGGLYLPLRGVCEGEDCVTTVSCP